MTRKTVLMMIPTLLFCLTPIAGAAAPAVEYKLLATNKTSTMEKEMNQAAADGFHFEGTMGGETAAGGNEIVVIMSRGSGGGDERRQYKLLATNKTSTMLKELNQAGAQGFSYVGQTIYSSTFGGKEVVVILESSDRRKMTYEYRLQATSRTSTMEKELNAAGRDEFQFCGITVAETAFGGKEVVSIMRRTVEQK